MNATPRMVQGNDSQGLASDRQNYPNFALALAADAAGAGRPGRAQDARVGLLAVRTRGDADRYDGKRLVADRGRSPPAGPQASGDGRPTPQHPTDTGQIHHLVRGVRAALGQGPDAVRVGRPAVVPPATATGAAAPPRRLGCLYATTSPTDNRARSWPRANQVTHERPTLRIITPRPSALKQWIGPRREFHVRFTCRPIGLGTSAQRTQRTKASLSGSHNPAPSPRSPAAVLNARRHHRRVHDATGRVVPVSPRCSTPEGIIVGFTE